MKTTTFFLTIALTYLLFLNACKAPENIEPMAPVVPQDTTVIIPDTTVIVPDTTATPPDTILTPDTPVRLWKQKLNTSYNKIIDLYGDNVILQSLEAINKNTGIINPDWGEHWYPSTSSRHCGDMLLFHIYGIHEDFGGLINLETGNASWYHNFGNSQTSVQYPLNCPTTDGNIFYVNDHNFYKYNLNTDELKIVFPIYPGGTYWPPYSYTNDAGRAKIVFNLKNITGIQNGIMLWDTETQTATTLQNNNIPAYSGIGYHQGYLYTSSLDTLCKINEATGELIWKIKITNPAGYLASMKFYENRLYLQSQNMQCFDLNTGEKYWEKSTIGPNIDIFHDRIIGIMPATRLLAFDAISGAGKWQIVPDGGAAIKSYYTDMSQNRVYITDSDKYMYCYELQ